MLQTYEDTLISHLTTMYASKRIAAVLPRQRLPTIHKHRLDSIQQAQSLIDRIIDHTIDKDDVLCDYIKWQHAVNSKS
jgi:hypothetical protein